MTWRPAPHREPLPLTDRAAVRLAIAHGLATDEERAWWEQGCPLITPENPSRDGFAPAFVEVPPTSGEALLPIDHHRPAFDHYAEAQLVRAAASGAWATCPEPVAIVGGRAVPAPPGYRPRAHEDPVRARVAASEPADHHGPRLNRHSDTRRRTRLRATALAGAARRAALAVRSSHQERP